MGVRLIGLGVCVAWTLVPGAILLGFDYHHRQLV
jgi:hypothetical protein